MSSSCRPPPRMGGRSKRRIGQQEHQRVLHHHGQPQKPQRPVQTQMTSKAGTLGGVLRPQVPCPGESQHPEQVQRSRTVERETSQAAFGHDQKHRDAGRNEHDRRNHFERLARLAHVIAHQQPKRREEPATGQHHQQRHDQRIRRPNSGIGTGEEISLKHPCHIEEIEQKTKGGVQHRSLP